MGGGARASPDPPVAGGGARGIPGPPIYAPPPPPRSAFMLSGSEALLSWFDTRIKL